MCNAHLLMKKKDALCLIVLTGGWTKVKGEGIKCYDKNLFQMVFYKSLETGGNRCTAKHKLSTREHAKY